MARAAARYDITARDKATGVVKGVKGQFQDMDSVVTKLTGGLSLLGAVNVGVFAAIYKSNAPVIDSLAKTADKLGVTTKALDGMHDAGERAGITNQNVSISLQRMTRRVAEAAESSGVAVKALDKIGLSAKELIKLSPDQQFAKISDELAKVENKSEKVALAFKFFDSGGVGLVNLTTSAIEEAKNEMDALGISISRLDAAGVEDANDALQRVQRNASGISRKFTAEISPAITGFINEVLLSDKAVGNVGETLESVSATAVKAAGFIGDTFNNISNLFDTFSLGIQKAEVGLLGYFEKKGLVTKKELLDATLDYNEAALALSDNVHGDKFSQRLKDSVQEAKEAAAARVAEIEKDLTRLADKDIIGAVLTPGTSNADNAAPKTPKIATPSNVVPITPDVINPALQAYNEYREGVVAQYDRLAEVYKTDEQRVYDSFEQKRALIEEFGALGYEQRQAADELQFAIEEEKQRKLTEIERAGLTERQQFEKLSLKNKSRQVFGELAALTSGVAQHNKALFKINKVAGIANAVVNTHEGVSRTLAKYPWPLSGVLAGLHFATGIAQVNAIKNASFRGGGGTAPSLSVSPGAPVTPVGGSSDVGSSSQPSDQQTTVTNNHFYGAEFLNREAMDNVVAQSLKRGSEQHKISYDGERFDTPLDEAV
ncbi:MAG: hypothetical protein GY938_28560 [Ketobacter sp.]|nr:hypothetical protein [Ketobacter sp.]